MSAWEELVTTALLGTERRALPQTLPDAVGRLAVTQPDPGLALLDAAAGYACYRQAGARPAACAAPALAPRQVLDLAPEQAQTLLELLLRSREVALVDTWLTACTTRGLGVRSGLWAPLATAATAASGPDRTLVRAALGQRGLAFVQLNPAWRALTRPARSAPDPDPGPTWSRSTTELALGAVQVTRALGRRRLVVAPQASGPALPELLAAADLDAWQPHTGLSPGPLLGLLQAAAGDRLPDLVTGLSQATVRQGHRGWAAALVRAGYVSAELAVLVPAELDRFVRTWAGRRSDAGQLGRVLVALPGPWSAGVAEAALRLLGGAVLDPATERRLALATAHRAPLSVHRELARLADDGPPAVLEQAADLMALRTQIQDSFPAPGPTSETP